MKSIRIFFLASLLSFPPVFALAYDAPRLWLAEKISNPKKKIYILAATHSGLPVEYDKYYSKVVIPAFMRSDVLHFEGAGGREAEPEPSCDESILDDEGRKILQKARDLTADQFVKNMQYQYALVGIEVNEKEVRPGMRSSMMEHDEFSILTFMRDSFLLTLRGKEREAYFDNGSMGEVVEKLYALRPNMPYKDLDTRYGARRAYCSAGKERMVHIQSTIDSLQTTGEEIKKLIPKWNEDFSLFVQDKETRHKTPLTEPFAMDREFLCGRNKVWLSEIEKSDDDLIDFLVVGARHVFDVDNNFAKCGGILTGLRNIGYAVNKIN
jgi:hypothetical protein